MTIAYFTTQGALITKEGERICLEKNQERVAEIIIKDLSAIIIFGQIAITPPALDLIFKNNISCAFLSLNGRLKARLVPVEGKNVPLRINQVLFSQDPDQSLALAQKFIFAKIHNQNALFQNFLSNHPEKNELKQAQLKLLELISQIPSTQNLDQLRGLEGKAQRVYFSAFQEMCLGELQFNNRSRRPPRDPMNALISLGYALILAEIDSFLNALGLDPDIGIFHKTRYARPALALDLLEEFRAPISDRLALFINNNRILKTEDFQTDPEKGVRLSETALKKYLTEYEKFITTEIQHQTGKKTSYRLLLLNQAERLYHFFNSNKEYQPFILRR